MASLLNNNNFETFVPVLFIILFLFLLFFIYAVNNLDLRSKFFNLYRCLCCCCCFGRKKKNTSVIYGRHGAHLSNFHQPPPPTARMMMPHHHYMHHAPPPAPALSGYYEGPTAGYYRVGFSEPPRFNNNNNQNYLYDHINPYATAASCYHPHMYLGGPPGIIKLNQLYRSEDGGDSFQLPPVTHLNSLSITSSTETSESAASHHHHHHQRSYSTTDQSSTSSMDQHQHQQIKKKRHQRAPAANTNGGGGGFFYNNNNYYHMPAKIMSEHELKNYINYNSRLDANLVLRSNPLTSNLRHHHNLSADLDRKHNDSTVVEQQHNHNHHIGGRLKKKIFSTSSNLFSGSSFRLSENNYTSLKNHHSSPNQAAESKQSLFSVEDDDRNNREDECRRYDSEPMRLAGLTANTSTSGGSSGGRKKAKNKKQRPPVVVNSFSSQRQHYLRSMSKLRKLSSSMSSMVMEKAANTNTGGLNLSQIAQTTSSTLIEYDRLKDNVAIQTATTTTNLQPPPPSNHDKETSHLSTSNVTSSEGCSSSSYAVEGSGNDDGASSSLFSSNSQQQTNQLIQSNTYGSIVGNFGSASMVVLQRSHTLHLIDNKEKQQQQQQNQQRRGGSEQMRTFNSEYNVQDARRVNNKRNEDEESYELPNIFPPSYEQQQQRTALTTQLVDLDIQV